MFKGCCYFNDGSYSNTIALKTIENTLDYLKLQVVTGKQARILDEDNRVVMVVVDGHIIIPEICSKVDRYSKKKKDQRGMGPSPRVCRR